MSRFLIHWGAEMKYGICGVYCDCTNKNYRTKIIKFESRPTFNDLLHRITITVGLADNKKVSQVIYRNPIIVNGLLHMSPFVIKDDDGIDFIFDNLRSLQGYLLVELLVDIGSVIDCSSRIMPSSSGEEVPTKRISRASQSSYASCSNLETGQIDLDFTRYFDYESLQISPNDDNDLVQEGNEDAGGKENVGSNEGINVPRELIDLNVPYLYDDGETFELSRGMKFDTKEDVEAAVKRYSIKNNVGYSVVESQPMYWVAKCIRLDEGCQWKLCAMTKPSRSYWVISLYDGGHSCFAPLLPEEHRRLIPKCIDEMITEDPKVKVKAIIESIRSRFNFQLSYRMVWQTKKHRLEAIFGDWEQSYRKLPAYLNALKVYNPGSVTELVVDDESHPSMKKFKRVFWSFKPCIDGFKHCKPILQVDATFLRGKYNHTLLIATSVDGNNRIFPVAFAIVESENKCSWSWFMCCMRKYVTQREGICVITNRHIGITSVMKHDTMGWKEPLAYHRFCLRHFASNYNAAHKNSVIKDLLYIAGNTYQSKKFKVRMEEILQKDAASFIWASQFPMKQWTLSHDSGRRYGISNTNLFECMNGIFKDVRKFPITHVLKHTLSRLARYFDARRIHDDEELSKGHKYTPFCRKEMRERELKANGHKVIKFDHHSGMFRILTGYDPIKKKGNNTLIVTLAKKECKCGKFQGVKMPCSHAIAACKYVHKDFWSYVDECYTLKEASKCYKTSLCPLGHEAYWPKYDGPMVTVDRCLKRKNVSR